MASETRGFSDGKDIRHLWDYLAHEQTLPQNANADGNAGARLLGNVQNALQLQLRCFTDISIADTQTFTVQVLESATEGGTYTNMANGQFTVTASGGAKTYSAGELIATFNIDGNGDASKPWKKVNILTNDAAAVGAVNVYVKHMPR